MMRVGISTCLAVSVLASPAVAASRTVEVMHYWVSGSERAALDVVKQEFARRGGTWIDNPQVNNIELHRVFADRLTTGTAPTALQWQGGIELAEMADIGLVDNYDALADRNKWETVLSESVKESVKYNGHYYLIPTNVHSENWIFYNTKVLREAEVSPPKTMAEFLAATEKLAAKGIVPISVGQSDWEAREIFVAVLTSVLGPDAFRHLVEDHKAAVLDEPAALEAVKMFQALARQFGPDATRPAGWAEATAAVGAGRAAFIVQGDWAKGELQKLGYQVGTDFGCLLMPGTEKVLSFAVDTFALPRSLGVDATEGRDMLIETVLDPKVQVAFSRLKGSVPVRMDVADSELDSCAVIAQGLLRTPHAVMNQPIRNMLTAQVADLHVLINRMARDKALKPEQALDELKLIFASAPAPLVKVNTP